MTGETIDDRTAGIVLRSLLDRFPALMTDEEVSGADVVERLASLLARARRGDFA